MKQTNRPFYIDFAWAYDLLIEAPVASRVDFIVEQLRLRDILARARLLDAGCGTGTYSIALAEKGFEIIGMDVSSELIKEAKKKAGGASGMIRFLNGDILNLSAGLEPDAILCRGVLNDLIEDEKRQRVIQSFAECIRPNGVLILDAREWESTVTRKTAEPIFEKVVETEKGRLTFRSETVLCPSNHSLLISETHTLESSSGPQVAPYKFVMRCWTKEELTARLNQAGFGCIEYFGDYDREKVVGETDRLVVVARSLERQNIK